MPKVKSKDFTSAPISSGENSTFAPILLGGLADHLNSNNGTQYQQQDRVYDSRGIAMCHAASLSGNSYRYLVIEDDEGEQGE